MNLVELFCHVDDFCQAFEAHWIRHQVTTGRRHQHHLFAGQAQWGKSSTGWFFGFKLHVGRKVGDPTSI